LQAHLKKYGFEAELRSVLSESVLTHAGFIRRDTGDGNLLEGWKETLSFLSRKKAARECQEAVRNLASDLSKENEEKMLALYREHDVNKAGNE
jgi:hypothetical protein